MNTEHMNDQLQYLQFVIIKAAKLTRHLIDLPAVKIASADGRLGSGAIGRSIEAYNEALKELQTYVLGIQPINKDQI
jgi:hypothetical protein